MIFVKKNSRSSYRSNRRSNYTKSNNLFSNNKSRVKGNITQLYDKYIKMAKEATASGDRIQAEYYTQFADHYSRLMVENGIKSYTNEKFHYVSNSNIVDDKLQENEEINNKDSSVKTDNITNENDLIEDESNETENSIETVPFIAKPAKKIIKTKK